jgi:hypothetical protein
MMTNFPSIVRKEREQAEKGIMERRKSRVNGDGRMKEMKFILANLLFIEWNLIHYQQSTEPFFIKNILLPLSEEMLSIEEEEKDEDISLPPDSFNGDSIILCTIIGSSLTSSSLHVDLLCCSERKVLQ